MYATFNLVMYNNFNNFNVKSIYLPINKRHVWWHNTGSILVILYQLRQKLDTGLETWPSVRLKTPATCHHFYQPVKENKMMLCFCWTKYLILYAVPLASRGIFYLEKNIQNQNHSLRVAANKSKYLSGVPSGQYSLFPLIT